MASEKLLVDIAKRAREWNELLEACYPNMPRQTLGEFLLAAPTVDAVEVMDKQLLRAVKLLIKQYEHSKQSDFVHNPIAHAFFHTWKQLDESGYGERREGE